MVKDLETAHFITKNYQALQGLVLVPLGAFMLIFGLGRLLGIPGFQQGDCSLMLIAFPIIIALTLLARKYYRQRFGEVRREIWLVLGSVGGWFLLSMLDMTWLGNLPVSFTMLGFALFFAMIAYASDGRRPHYYSLAAGLVLIAFLPLLDVVDKMDLFSGQWHGNLFVGAVLVIGGLLDHRLLIHTLTPAAEAQS
jgi:hypothetical protein